MNNSSSIESQPNNFQQPLRANNFWWALFIFLLLWNIIGLFYHPSGSPVVTLPYSVFIKQVHEDNVAVVRIVGSQISGSFIQPVRWPDKSGTGDHPAATSAARHSEAPEAGEPPKLSDGSPPKVRKPPAGWPFNGIQHLKPADYTAFMTTFPQTVGDSQLLPMLEQHGVQITAEQPKQHWLSTFLMNLLPFVLLIAYFWWMGQRAMKQQASIFGRGASPAKQFDASRPGVTFEDVAGADSAKRQLEEEVDFLRTPDKYHAIGARIPRGVLLVGPPGTGKTLLARAVAGEANVPFFSISGSEFVEMFVGMGASRVRSVFKQAKAAAPSILFIDELDAVGRRRGMSLGSVNDEREQTLNQLLVEMDGFDARENVIIIAATNRPDVLDPALLRPGRFDRQITVGLPDSRGRRGILAIHTRPLQLATDVDLDVLATMTIGMSGAQLANLCNEAALITAAAGRQRLRHGDFEAALDKLVLGDAMPLVLDEQTRRVIAYHESGHALVAWFTAQADTVHKVTIVPHGQALGVTEQRPDTEQYNVSRRYLLARIAVLLGGRGAEALVMGDITTGAENDLAEATRLARQMVTSWGMSSLGLAHYQPRNNTAVWSFDNAGGHPVSEQTAAQIDRQIADLLEQQYAYVQQLLKRERDKLERLAKHLLHAETVEHAELYELLGSRPASLQPEPGPPQTTAVTATAYCRQASLPPPHPRAQREGSAT